VAVAELPSILLEDGRLAGDDAGFVLALLATVPLSPPHRCYATPESLDAFAPETIQFVAKSRHE
jgi:hypothetical protein